MLKICCQNAFPGFECEMLVCLPFWKALSVVMQSWVETIWLVLSNLKCEPPSSLMFSSIFPLCSFCPLAQLLRKGPPLLPDTKMRSCRCLWRVLLRGILMFICWTMFEFFAYLFHSLQTIGNLSDWVLRVFFPESLPHHPPLPQAHLGYCS